MEMRRRNNVNEKTNQNKAIRKIGIVVEPEACFGAQCNDKGEVALIENGPFGDHDFENCQGYELEHEAGVRGYTSLLDAGIAVSDIGIALRRISKNATGYLQPNESVHAVISMPSEHPVVEQIEKYMAEQEVLAKTNSEKQFAVDIYHDLELKNLNSYELLEKAAEYAGIEKYMVVFRPLAIAYAYEYGKPEMALAEGTRGLIYDWGKNYFSASIVEKYHGQVEVWWSETIENPAKNDDGFLYYMNEEYATKQKFYFYKTMDVIYEMCDRSGYSLDTISSVYLAGEYCNLPEVISQLEGLIGKVYSMEDNRLTALHGVARIAECWGNEEEDVVEDVQEEPVTVQKVSQDIKPEMEETSGKKNRISLVPTLFKFKSGILTRTSDGIEVDLCRIYDDSIKNKYMQTGNVFNALLPYIEKASSKIYSYQGETQIDFKLRKKPNNRMLMLKLIDSGDAVAEYEEKSFAHAVFFASASSTKKGMLQLKCSLDEYEKLEALDENKYLILDDQKNQIKYVFECWIEQLPMPGVDEGVYVYSDGSSNNDTDPEVFGAGYVLNVGKDVYFGHKDGKDKGRNVSAEYLAGTNVFQFLPDIADDCEEVTLYFDNINVGYVAAGVYHSSDNFGAAYFQMFEEYIKAHPNTKVTFVHTDSHSGIYGNEIADQMAQGKEKDLMKLANGFKESRDKICPKDGSFSKAMKFVGE